MCDFMELLTVSLSMRQLSPSQCSRSPLTLITNGEVAVGFDYQFHSLCVPKNENTKVSEFIHISPFGDRMMGFICLNAFCGINQQLLSKCLSIQESLP